MLPLPISGRLLFPLTFRRCRLPECLHELSRTGGPGGSHGEEERGKLGV